MNICNSGRSASNRARDLALWLTCLSALSVLTACGSGEDNSVETPVASSECIAADPTTFSNCGTLMVALTDADGDFLNYTVDVVSLKLETATGRIVETLPGRTRINFTDYVDLTELVTVATIPPATYVAGTISLDYTDAEIFVEADGAAKAAAVTDVDGNELLQTELRMTLSNRDQLKVVKGRSALLQLDFDLDASHTVDIAPTPANAISEQFIVAEVTPVDEKDIRVRGPLINVSEDDMSYTVAIRPFHDRDGDFGRVKVLVSDDTEFEVDGTLYAGVEGLRALSADDEGTSTIAEGTLDVAERQFTANFVLAGFSVPGIDRDAVMGNVIARDDNLLTVRGATIIASDRRAHFHDDVTVEVGPETRVLKDGSRTLDLGIDDISIGQRVTIRGTISKTVADAATIHVDASDGAVRMHVTHLLGVVNTVVPGQVDISLHGIDRRRAEAFDFSGTGVGPGDDADPGNYEVATGNLTLASFAEGKPVVAYGFPTAFGTAPSDFGGRTVVDYTDVRSAMGIGWGSTGTSAPFTSTSSDGLVVNGQNDDIDQRHHIKNGPFIIDLTTLDSDATVVPRVSDRSLFYIKSNDSLRQYSEFDDFVEDLNLSLNGATLARSMHVRGHYDSDTNTLTAYKIGLYLIEP
jgi:hypothetical protein